MIDWLFRPTLNAFEIFVILVLAEWVIPDLGLWAFIPLIILFILSNKIESAVWRITKHDRQDSE